MAGVGVNGLSAVLLGYGVVNFVGPSLTSRLLEQGPKLTLVAMPAVMIAIRTALVVPVGAPVVGMVLVALWGMAFGGVPVAWTTWVTQTVSDEAESAGGLIVAAV